jgi:hypothetical protein
MVWNIPKTWVSNEVLTADDLNLYLRDNLNETAPAKATSPGGWFIGAGPNQIVERVPKFAWVTAAEETDGVSSGFNTLATVGPSVTVTTGSRALIFLSSGVANAVNESSSFMGYAISGATTQNPASGWSLRTDGISADKSTRRFAVFMEEDLVPGVNTFTAQYQVGTPANIATFEDRFMAVWPF